MSRLFVAGNSERKTLAQCPGKLGVHNNRNFKYAHSSFSHPLPCANSIQVSALHLLILPYILFFAVTFRTQREYIFLRLGPLLDPPTPTPIFRTWNVLATSISLRWFLKEMLDTKPSFFRSRYPAI
jgi:hypothetical protein